MHDATIDKDPVGDLPPGVAAARAIGAAVRALRRNRCWSIEQLAERAEVSYQYLSEIETGKRNFSIVVLDRIARALELTLLAIVGAALAPQAQGGGAASGRLPKAA